ncbi:MAG: hypothetical protein L6Q99_11805 [Planctomycetes bacterium]|nr:hypothetical protein [Planctomycetota bacterium]
MLRTAFQASIVLFASIPVLAGGVRIVEPTGTANFATVQAAIDAASDGAVILVGPGTYPGFQVSNKSLVVAAAMPGTVMIAGVVTISGLTGSKSVLLSELAVQSQLAVLNCSGHVRVQGSDFSYPPAGGGYCSAPPSPGSPAARIVNSTKVAFVACQLTGGDGDDFLTFDDCSCFDPGTGGSGLDATNSSVALYDCVVAGGIGGASECLPARGGIGVAAGGGSIVASNTQFIGGAGGDRLSPWQPGMSGGIGGDAEYLVLGGTFHEIGCSFTGGAGGSGWPQGAPGNPFFGSPPISLGGAARVATLAPYVGGDASTWSVAFAGVPGDKVYSLGSLSPGFQISPPFHGAWLVLRSALLPIVALGQVNPQGALNGAVGTGDLPAGSLVGVVWGQVAARALVGPYLATPATFVLLDRQSGPDCNANGVCDFVEVIEGTAPDANGNLIPDGCPGG